MVKKNFIWNFSGSSGNINTQRYLSINAHANNCLFIVLARKSAVLVVFVDKCVFIFVGGKIRLFSPPTMDGRNAFRKHMHS